MTVDNAITNHSVRIVNDSNYSKIFDNQKKRKNIDDKKKKTTLSKQKKKTQKDIDICHKNKKEVCSYSNCLNGQIQLEDCAVNNCSNKLHHLFQNNIDNVSFDSQFEERYGNAFMCSKSLEECMKKESQSKKLLDDTDSESEDEIINLTNKNNYNDDDDDSNVAIFNKNGEENDDVEETILDDYDNTTLNNIEDAKNDKAYNDVVPKMFVLSVVYEVHFFETNMNVYKDLLKNKKAHFFMTNMNVFKDLLKNKK